MINIFESVVKRLTEAWRSEDTFGAWAIFSVRLRTARVLP